MSAVTLSSRIPRSESVEVTKQEQESREVEDAEINLQRGAKRYGSGRARNLRYGVIKDNLCEQLFVLTLGISHRFAHYSASCL
jgi:hypothetical protein